MSRRSRGSVGGGRGQQYSNVATRGGHYGGSRGGRGDGSRGGPYGGSRGGHYGGSRGGRGSGGRGRGRSPAGTTSESSSQPSSSSVSVSTPTRLQEVESSVQKHVPPPASSKAMRLPSRPGFGTDGETCLVKANHFFVEFDVNKDIHRYDVTITPEIASKKVSRRIIRQLVSKYKQSRLDNRILAYDGRRSAYTARPLPFTSDVFDVTLSDEDDVASSRRQKEYKVSINFAAKVDLHHLLEFLNSNQVDAPQETIQALNVVLRNTPSAKYETVGRSFFSPELGTKGTLGEGVEYWKGYYQSLRPTQMGLSLNIDTSAKPFYEPILVTEFISKLLNIPNSTEPLSAQDFVKVKRALRGIIVETEHLGYVKRQKVSRFTDDPLRDLSFPSEERGADMYVVEYFYERYRTVLEYKFWPAFLFGTDSKPVYLPMEICKIAEYQRYARKLSTSQNNALLKATCERPIDREENIKWMVRNNRYDTDMFGNEFGVRVRPELTSVSARVLPGPTLKYYNETGGESLVVPRVGEWNMIGKKVVDGGKVDFWTCINFSESHDVAQYFCERLLATCRSIGMVFSQSFLPFQSGYLDLIEENLVDIQNQFKRLGLDGKRIQLLIVILPEKSGYYGTIKRVCETKLGIVSQCCKPEQVKKANRQYLVNVALKINVKVGGRNTVLQQAVQKNIPCLNNDPTIIFGADVSHPSRGEDSISSIAAVVGSIDWPEVTKYRGLVSAQKHRQEIIQDLYKEIEDPQGDVVDAGMIRELLFAFYKSTGLKPRRIIFYRDGVGEGQFNQVLLEEIGAIRKACASLEATYKPLITFIVVQKRHHTRLFPANHSNRFRTDKSGNILPGTVVDTTICHPMEFDFFLCSHAGIQGTSRPTHYHVLYDENEFSADALQKLTYDLCYTYARCTKSVSIVPPARYAHLLAERARFYNASSGGSNPERAAREGDELPAIIDNVKDFMFYC